MYRPIYWPTLDRYVGRHIYRHSTDISTEICRSTYRLLYRSIVARHLTNMSVDMSTESGCLIVGRHVDWEVTDISPILHWYLATGVFLCFAWQRLNDPNIKPSEIFKAEQKMGITGSLRFWLYTKIDRYTIDSRPIFHRQSTYRPSLGCYIPIPSLGGLDIFWNNTIGAFYSRKQKKCSKLVIKQLPCNPTSKNSEQIYYFEEVFHLKQQQKHTILFVTNF